MSNDHTRNKNNYDYLNGAVVREKVRSAQYPTMAKLSVSMTLLEKRAPRTQARHFGDSTPENSPNTPDESIPTGDFNHQLIHFDEPPESTTEPTDTSTPTNSSTDTKVTGPPPNSRAERLSSFLDDTTRTPDAG